jgi:hypothetical protein
VESEVLILLPNGWGGGTFSIVRLILLVRKYLNTIGLIQLVTMTSLKQTSLFTEETSTSSAEDSHANLTQWPGKDLARKMRDTSGQRCLEQLGKFSQVGLWAKMFSELLIGQGDWFSTRCRLTWKLRGTKYNRMYFQLRPLAHHTEGTESGSLPTPEHFDYNSARHPELWEKDKKKYAERGINLHCNLRQQARLGMLPTPNTRDWKDNIGNGIDAPSIGVTRGYSLGQKINSMLPTPRANDMNHSTRIEQPSFQHRLHRDYMAEVVIASTNPEHGQTSQLNPLFVAEMMGFPTDWTVLPFLNGETNLSKDMGMQ